MGKKNRNEKIDDYRKIVKIRNREIDLLLEKNMGSCENFSCLTEQSGKTQK